MASAARCTSVARARDYLLSIAVSGALKLRRSAAARCIYRILLYKRADATAARVQRWMYIYIHICAKSSIRGV